MIRLSRKGAREHARAGFTLIEILVALVISGLVISSLFRVMQGNGQFVQMQSAREEVQQNARAALDIIAADLRAMPPAALVTMEPRRIRFLQPRAWGILCNTLKPASATAWVLFPAGVLPAETFFGRQNWGLGIEQTNDPLLHNGTYRFIAAPTQATSGDPCAAVQAAPSAQHVRLGFNTPGGPYVTGDSVAPGSQVLLYEELQYDVASSGGAVPGSWIRRMSGYASGSPNMQPMAGPVPDSSGVRFTYMRADGTNAAIPAQVRRIGIQVVTQSRAVTNQGGTLQPQQVDTASTVVYLRNIPG